MVPADAVPERWKGRGQEVVLIPLLDEEAENILESGSTEPSLEPIDERIVGLVLRGRSIAETAQQLGIGERTVNRRLRRLKNRYEIEDRSSFREFFSGLQ